MAQDLKSILDKATISDDVKADVWDAYKASTSTNDLVERFKKVPISDGLKADLWDLKQSEIQQTQRGPLALQPLPEPPPKKIETPETISQRVRRLAGYFIPENPVRTGFGIGGAALGATATLPSWVAPPLAIPAAAVAGGAGYTGGTHLYDLITGTMPGGARTSWEYARQIPSEFAAGAVQEGLGPAVSSAIGGAGREATEMIRPTLARVLTRGGTQAAEKAAGEYSAKELATELAKAGGKMFGGERIGEHIGGWIGEISGIGKEHGKTAGEVLGVILASPLAQQLTAAGKAALVDLVNRGAIEEVIGVLEGELVWRGLSPGPVQSRADAMDRLDAIGRMPAHSPGFRRATAGR